MKLLILTLFVIQALAQQSITVSNAASHDFGSSPSASVAPGSLITVNLNFQGGPLTPIDPATVSIQLQPGGSVKFLGTAGPIGVLGLLSDDAPTGRATLTLTFNGQTSAPADLAIVPVNFGLFTRNNGIGPVMAQNSLSHAPKPGDFVTLWGTGLGTSAATVLLGGHPVIPTYAGPAPGLPGTDQINFQIPADPTIPNGCYVAVAVGAGGYTSNTGMLSTSPDGGPCTSPFGLSSDQLAQLDAGRMVPFGQVNLYNMLGPPASPSPWFYADGFTRTESAAATFLQLDALGVAQWAQPLVADDVAYACTARVVRGVFLSTSQFINVGNKVTLSTAGSALDLQGVLYTAQVPQPPAAPSPDQVPPSFFVQGPWQVSFPGSSTVAPFTGQFSLPSTVHITNAGDLGTLNRTQDVTVNWNGADYTNDYTATVQLSAPDSTLVCTTPAAAGKLTIPAALLPSAPQAALELLLLPKPDHLTVLHDNAMPILLRYYPSEVIPVEIQ